MRGRCQRSDRVSSLQYSVCTQGYTNLFNLQRVKKAGYGTVLDTWLPIVDYNTAFIKNTKGKTVGYIMEDESGRGIVSCKILMPSHTAVKNDVGYYADAMAASGSAKRPKLVEHIGTTSGFPQHEGAGQSWGAPKAQTGRGRSDGRVEKPINENVSLPSFPDLESLTSSDTHDNMPRLGIERESLDWSIFDDAGYTIPYGGNIAIQV